MDSVLLQQILWILDMFQLKFNQFPLPNNQQLMNLVKTTRVPKVMFVWPLGSLSNAKLAMRKWKMTQGMKQTNRSDFSKGEFLVERIPNQALLLYYTYK